MKSIEIRGARTHNLKNIDLDIPRDKLVVITGLSGSGKSSLAFDTLYAEGQRRYVESLSAYARQFLSMMDKPDVDSIEGLSPAISIEQKSTSHNPRSTVGTVTEIYDYLRLLFARIGEPRCPDHGKPLAAQSVSEMVDQVMAIGEKKGADTRVQLLAPIVRNRKGEHTHRLNQLRAEGYVRVRIDGIVTDLDDLPEIEKNKNHNIEVVVDRFKVRDDIQQRLAESFETAIALSEGIAIVAELDDDQQEHLFSSRFACPICDYSLNELEPRLFSFNNPMGACSSCDGLGVTQFFDEGKIVLHPEASIAEGAIRGWDRRNLYYFQMLTSLAKHYKFSLEVPFEELEEDQRKVVLQGTGEQQIDITYINDRGDTYKRRHRFEGIIPNFTRRYRETESESVREELGKYMTTSACQTCGGSRLCLEARNVFVKNTTLPSITSLSVEQAVAFFKQLDLQGNQQTIGQKILKEIGDRLYFLADVGLGYLSLDRSADTLSGGEAQRIRLASQIGAGLVGVMYVLDEPSIGLHQRDNERLLGTLRRLRDLGNTVIVVEHDEEAIRAADYLIDVGPGAGVHGGKIVAQGGVQDILDCKESLTGDYLSGRRQITAPEPMELPEEGSWLTLTGARGNNLKNVTLKVPVGRFTCITGVSGSGKSTLINDTLYPLAATALNKATTLKAAPHDDIKGLDQFINCVDIDQSPIGRTPRSNPATYTGLFTLIRDIFSETQESRARGYKPGRFSFNVKGGRCEKCQGDGLIKVEMHFLPDVYVLCETCKGKRYNRETLEVKFKGKSIHQVLDMTIEDALLFFDAVPSIKRKLDTLMSVGLSYVKLGQSATTLSGGEAQRVKLAKELAKRNTGQTLYILDEPTTGLHFQDIKLLLDVLHKLRTGGNTVIVIEHNLDVIKTSDWIIDLGPEGGAGGGQIIAEGSPKQLSNIKESSTGHFLKKVFNSA
jgi:excinuclease ABC subunit A